MFTEDCTQGTPTYACMHGCLHSFLRAFCAIGLCARSKIKNPYLYAAHILGEEIDNTKVRK